MPQAALRDLPSDAVDQELLTVAGLTRQARRGEALAILAKMRTQAGTQSITASLFEVQVLAAEARLVGAGSATRTLGDIRRSVETRRQLVEQRLDAAVVRLSRSEAEDLALARQLGFALPFCLTDMPDFLTFEREMKRQQPQLVTQEPARSCVADLQRVIDAGVNAGYISPQEGSIALLVAKARNVLAAGETAEAIDDLKEAVDTAASLGRNPILLRLELADVYAAPTGSPLTFGYRLGAEQLARPSFIGQIRARESGSGADPRSAEAELVRIGLEEARKQNLEGAWRLRRAWLLSKAADLRAAFLEYRDSANAASREGDRLTAAFAQFGRATLSGSDQDVQAAFDSLERTDRASALSLVETTLSWSIDAFVTRGIAITPAALVSVSRARADTLGLQLASDEVGLFLIDLNVATGRLDRAIDDGQQSVARCRARLAEVQASAVTEGNSDDRLLLDLRMDLVSLLNRLRAAVSNRALVDRTPDRRWTARLDDVTAQLRSARTAEGDDPLEALVGRVSTLEAQRTRLLDAFDRTLDCPALTRQVEQMTTAAQREQDAVWRLQLQALMVPCDPARTARVVAGLTALDPVGALRTVLTTARAPGGDIFDALNALGSATGALLLAQQFRQLNLLDAWSSGLAKLEDPLVTSPPFSISVLRARAFSAAGHQEFAAARGYLERALALSLNIDEPRTWLLGDLLDIEIASGDASRALETLLRLRRAREQWLARRSGFASVQSGSTELAMLESKLAVEGLPAEALARLADLRRLAAEPPPTDSIEDDSARARQKLLAAIPDRTMVLAYHVSATGVTVWVLQRGSGPVMRPLPIDVLSLNRTAVNLKQALRSKQLPGTWQTDATRLFNGLIAPVGSIPEGWTLAIATSGELLDLPFEVLGVDEKSPTILRNPIVYLASLSVGDGQPASTGPKRSPLVVGVNEGAVIRAEDEAIAVGRWLGPPLLGDGAGLDVILRRLPEAPIAHFATHGVLDSSNPYLSYLQVGNNQQLTAWQLAEYLRGTDMLVLSACDTIRPAVGFSPLEHDPSDVTSFAAFAFAGKVHWVVASLWKAKDQETLRMIEAFYAALSQRTPPAVALQQVKRARAADVLPSDYAHLVISARNISSLSVVVELPKK